MSEPTRQELEAAIAEQRSKPDYVRQIATFCDAPERAALLACAYKMQAQDAELAELRTQLESLRRGFQLHTTPIANVILSGDAEYFKSKAEEAERKLGDLLARIHRDGGHYTNQHGMEKSVEDAHAIVANLFADERKLEEAGNMGTTNMTDHTDLEITRACASFYPKPKSPGGSSVWGCSIQFAPIQNTTHFVRNTYRPLDDDAQNAALDEVLLKYGHYRMSRYELHYVYGDDRLKTFTPEADMTVAANRRRARCLCVYKIWESLR